MESFWEHRTRHLSLDVRSNILEPRSTIHGSNRKLGPPISPVPIVNNNLTSNRLRIELILISPPFYSSPFFLSLVLFIYFLRPDVRDNSIFAKVIVLLFGLFGSIYYRFISVLCFLSGVSFSRHFASIRLYELPSSLSSFSCSLSARFDSNRSSVLLKVYNARSIFRYRLSCLLPFCIFFSGRGPFYTSHPCTVSRRAFRRNHLFSPAGLSGEGRTRAIN